MKVQAGHKSSVAERPEDCLERRTEDKDTSLQPDPSSSSKCNYC